MMEEEVIKKASVALTEEKERLIAYLYDRMSTVVLPECQLVEEAQPVALRSMRIKPFVLVGLAVVGIVSIIAGICLKETLLWIEGVAAVVIGLSMMLRAKYVEGKRTDALPDNDALDFPELSNALYNALEGACAHIVKEWDAFVGQQNAWLGSAIQSLDYDEERKSEMIDKLARRSLIELSMMDAFTELNSTSRTRNLMALKGTKDTIIERFAAEITRACEEQLSSYASL